MASYDSKQIPPASPRLISLRQAQNQTGMGKTYLYAAIARGEIRKVKIGRVTRLIEADIQAWIVRKIASAAR